MKESKCHQFLLEVPSNALRLYFAMVFISFFSLRKFLGDFYGAKKRRKKEFEDK